jgi:hypothetical protein
MAADQSRRKFERDLRRALLEEERSRPAKAASMLAFMNQPFVLWLLTATVLSVAGAYFTTSRECHIAAHEDYERFRGLGEEITARIWTISDRYNWEGTLDRVMFKEYMTGERYFRSDYKGRTLTALSIEYEHMHDRVSVVPDFANRLIKEFRLESEDSPQGGMYAPLFHKENNSFSLTTTVLADDVAKSHKSPKKDDKAYEGFTKFLTSDLNVVRFDDELRSKSEPEFRCGFQSVVEFWWTGVRPGASVILHPIGAWEQANPETAGK